MSSVKRQKRTKHSQMPMWPFYKCATSCSNLVLILSCRLRSVYNSLNRKFYQVSISLFFLRLLSAYLIPDAEIFQPTTLMLLDIFIFLSLWTEMFWKELDVSISQQQLDWKGQLRLNMKLTRPRQQRDTGKFTQPEMFLNTNWRHWRSASACNAERLNCYKRKIN